MKTTGVVRVPCHRHRQRSGLGRDETRHQKLLSRWCHPCCWSRAYGELKQARELHPAAEPDGANDVQGKSVTLCSPGCAANILRNATEACGDPLACVTQRGQNQVVGASSRVAQYKRLKAITRLMVTRRPLESVQSGGQEEIPHCPFWHRISVSVLASCDTLACMVVPISFGDVVPERCEEQACPPELKRKASLPNRLSLVSSGWEYGKNVTPTRCSRSSF